MEIQFLAVVDRGSFSGASSSLGITQQALSKGISNLEDELGVRVFDRDTRNVTLPRFGKMLLEGTYNTQHEQEVNNQGYTPGRPPFSTFATDTVKRY